MPYYVTLDRDGITWSRLYPVLISKVNVDYSNRHDGVNKWKHFLRHDDVNKWKHFPRYSSFVRGIHRSLVDSPHKGQWRGSLMFVCLLFGGFFVFFYLRINSYRHKYISIHDILAKKHVDYLAISESKLDDSFLSAQFPAHDYSLYRQDVSSSSGGLLVYVRADLSYRRLNHAEINVEGFESLCIEITVGKTTTILSCIYKHPKLKMMFLNVISQIWLTLSLELIAISCFSEIWTVVQQKIQWFKIFVRSMGVLILLPSPRVIRVMFLRSLMSYLWLIRTSISALWIVNVTSATFMI